MENDQALREHLVKMLKGGQAFVSLKEILDGIPYDLVGERPHDLTYSLWQLIRHLYLAQQDIVDFCINPDYKEPRWPDEYWPQNPFPDSEKQWEQNITDIHKGIEQMAGLVKDPKNDLFAPVPQGNGQTLLREAMLIAQHNAYHSGEIIVLRRLLGIW